MFFCPNCKNSLSIAQGISGTGSSVNQDKQDKEEDVTPVTVSSSESEVIGSNVGQKRNQENAEDGGDKEVNSNKAYLKCSNCGYTQEIAPGTMILSRVAEKTTTDFSDHTKYKDMVYDMTLPITRNYICPNKNCKSQQDPNMREAVWFKPSRHSFEIVYVCRACHTVI